MREKYLLVLGENGHINQGIIDDLTSEIANLGYTPVELYISYDLLPTFKDQYGNVVPDFDKILLDHGISTYEASLDTSDPGYVDPYALVRANFQSVHPHIQLSDIHVVVFDQYKTPWSDIEISYIFTQELDGQVYSLS